MRRLVSNCVIPRIAAATAICGVALPKRRWCASTVTGGESPVATPTAANSTSSRAAPLDDVEELTDGDKQLIRESLSNSSTLPQSRMGGQGVGPAQGDMMALFTCTKCEVRSVKRFTKHSYTKGIVIVECPGCYNKHLLADNLGWFGDEHTNIEQVLRARGEEFIRVRSSIHVESLSMASVGDVEATTDTAQK